MQGPLADGAARAPLRTRRPSAKDDVRAQARELRGTLKSHNPKTVRKNTGDDYHGCLRCLRVDVRRSSSLYHRIEAWSAAIMNDG
jgi:hypothetical protein